MSVDGQRPPKLLDQVRSRIRAKHLSRSTEKTYVSWIRRYIFFHNKRHPKERAETPSGVGSSCSRPVASRRTLVQGLSAVTISMKVRSNELSSGR